MAIEVHDGSTHDDTDPARRGRRGARALRDRRRGRGLRPRDADPRARRGPDAKRGRRLDQRAQGRRRSESSLQAGDLQLSLFDETNLAEIASREYPGERLVVCRNPPSPPSAQRKRDELLGGHRAELEKIRAMVQRPRGTLHSADAGTIGTRVGQGGQPLQGRQALRARDRRRRLLVRAQAEQIAAEAALDGLYVIRTTCPAAKLASPAAVVRAYKQLKVAERAFRTMKDQLEIRPIHHHLEDRVRARVPLVIAGSVGREVSSAPRLAALVASLTPGVHFDADEYGRDVELTEAGVEQVERALGVGSLHDAENYGVLTELNCALHAQVLLRRDVDYIVRDGRIGVIDEFTGRVVADRHWPDGLQAALEAKEGIERQPDGRILGSITLQHFLQGYPRLCGMTGTAQTAAPELRELYGLDVVVVPTHRPMIRVDHPDVVFTHRDAKERAVVDEIRRAHASGRPVLVGTLTVEESERLAARLRDAGVACEILNAKNDAMEARVDRPRRRASVRSLSPRTWPAGGPTSGWAARTRRNTSRSPRSAAST